MLRSPIKSSTLRSAGYNVDNMTLELEFTSGEIYQYFRVPHADFVGLMRAGSHGEYFNQCIRDQYSFRKVT